MKPATPISGTSNRVWCRFAGPGRGDCSHFVGLPAEFNEKTTDEWGIPHGWCEYCWSSHQLDKLKRQLAEAETRLASVASAVDEVGTYLSDDQGFILDSNKSECTTCGKTASTSIEIKHDVGCFTKAWQDLLESVSSSESPAHHYPKFGRKETNSMNSDKTIIANAIRHEANECRESSNDMRNTPENQSIFHVVSIVLNGIASTIEAVESVDGPFEANEDAN